MNPPQDRPRARFWFVPWALLVLLAVLMGALLRPPAPRSAEATPLDAFAAGRALETLETIAKEPHAWHSMANVRVREFILERFEAHGWETTVHRLASEGAIPTVNILARLPGTDSTGVVLLAAHYDSSPRAPGAADDGAAVASLLEVARILRQEPRRRNDIVILITDGEEAGLRGARDMRLAGALPEDIAVVLNFEARGASGLALMFQTHPGNAPWLSVYADYVERPASNSLMVSIYRVIPNDTDFSEFRRAKLAGLNFAFIGSPERYHEPTDTIANLDPRSVQHQGDQALALARGFGDHDLHTLTRAPDPVHFDVLTRVLLRYSVTLAWILAVLTTLRTIFVLWRGLVRDKLPVARALLRLVMTWLWIIASVGALGWVWLQGHAATLSQAAPATPHDAWAHLACILVGTGVALVSLQRVNPRAVLLASVGLLTAGLLALAVVVPGGTFLFQWPLVGLLVWLALTRAGTSPSVAGYGAAVLAVLPTLVLVGALLPLLADGLLMRLVMAPAALGGLFVMPVCALLSDAGARPPLRAGWFVLGAGLLLYGGAFLL